MPLLKGGRFVADDWRPLADDEPLPESGRIIVPVKRLQAEADGLRRFAGELGVRIEPGERVETVADWLPRLALVALPFPNFADGRAFSTASILRERYRFTGEIRAVGDVLVDQFPFMRQCGFDAFAIAEGRALTSWQKAQVEIGLSYRTDPLDENGPVSIFRARRRQAAPAAG